MVENDQNQHIISALKELINEKFNSVDEKFKAVNEKMDEKFRSVHLQINTEFEITNDRLDKIEIQTTRTNGRVTQLEKDEISHLVTCPVSGKLETLATKIEKDIDNLYEEIEVVNNELLEYKFWKKFPTISLIGVVVAVILMGIAMGNLYLNVKAVKNSNTTQMEANVNEQTIPAKTYQYPTKK
jgi:hypothetical protein